MIIKRGKAEILDVIKDTEHSIDNDGTHKVLAKSKKITQEPIEEKTKKDNNIN